MVVWPPEFNEKTPIPPLQVRRCNSFNLFNVVWVLSIMSHAYATVLSSCHCHITPVSLNMTLDTTSSRHSRVARRTHRHVARSLCTTCTEPPGIPGCLPTRTPDKYLDTNINRRGMLRNHTHHNAMNNTSANYQVSRRLTRSGLP